MEVGKLPLVRMEDEEEDEPGFLKTALYVQVVLSAIYMGVSLPASAEFYPTLITL